MARPDIHAEITASILEQLRQGIRPWMRPWDDGGKGTPEGVGLPLRETGEPYSGVNVLVLWTAAQAKGYTAPTWMTFNQARRHGGAVRKGEKSQTVVYAKTYPTRKRDPVTDEEKVETVGFLRNYRVFNVEQIDGLDERWYRSHAEIHPINPDRRSERLDTFFASLGIDIRHGGNDAYYVLNNDYIQMPPFELFHDASAYYTTLAHESVHWTRHADRLNRKFRGAHQVPYAKEELVAEIGAAFLSAELGITPAIRDDHADYIGAWLKVLQDDNKAIFNAASLATKAVGWIMARGEVESLRVDTSRVPAEGVDESTTTAEAPVTTPAWPDHGVPSGAVQGELFRSRPEDVTRLMAARDARRFVADALVFRDRAPLSDDGGAWRGEAARLLDVAGSIDLAVPGVAAAVEAAVAVAAARPAEVVSAERFVADFRDVTQRRVQMADLTETRQQTMGGGVRL